MERLAVLTDFDRRVLEVFSLALGHSLRLPAPLEPARERLARSLHRAMNEATRRLTSEIADAAYRHERN